MKKNILALSIGAMALLTFSVTASAQRTAPPKKAGATSNAETGLGGIKLFDSGVRVVALYGSPTVIEAVSIGGGNGGAGGGAAGGAGGRGLPGAGGNGVGSGAPSPANGPVGLGYDVPGSFDFADDVLARQGRPGGNKGGGAQAAQGPVGIGPAGMGNGGNAGGAGGGGGVSGGSSSEAQYTRWIYNRQGVKYGFILDKYNRVVQCEAIGLTSGKAKTRRGVTFGTTFATIIKKYGAPDGYEVGGNTIVVRYLNKAKCAFQLSRLADNKPHVVTGIVVAAGKR